MVASGNDFVIAELRAKSSELRNLAREFCNRKYGVGADGLLILEKSKIADIRMRIFNADGSEAQMCGNGARCVALYQGYTLHAIRYTLAIETKAGIIESEVNGDNVKIKLTDPKDIKLDFPVKVNKRNLRVNFIDTGVPHVVIFVEGLDKIDVVNLGKEIRYHKRFFPRGTNVNFIEILGQDSLKIRTYERGVEDETLACGTGAVASALVLSLKSQVTSYGKIDVHTKSREILKVYFDRRNSNFENVWLEGKTCIVFQGEIDAK